MKGVVLIGFSIITFCLALSLINESFAIFKESAINHKQYKVQEYSDIDRATDMLAIINKNIDIIVNHLGNKYSKSERVNRLKKRLNKLKIEEAPHEEDSSSYTINKGELMAVCLRKKNENKELHNIQTLMFVIIHELAHIMTISEGHTKEFMENFRFILEEAQLSGIYIPQNYKIDPMVYCGVKVTHNPYYNH